ncbi:transposase [Umezawaea sp. Da 62-37]|uniref:transposase n=1 Tax=Umezawaea sp. Da 62-37 TaxID=3075927 RepID=UPI0037DDB9DB
MWRLGRTLSADLVFVTPADARWALIEPTLTAWRAVRRGLGTAARVHDLREIVNAIVYVCRTGIA